MTKEATPGDYAFTVFKSHCRDGLCCELLNPTSGLNKPLIPVIYGGGLKQLKLSGLEALAEAAWCAPA